MTLDVAPLEAARELLGLSRHRLWEAYFELGGNSSPADVGQHLSGGPQLTRLEHDVLVHALNEEFLDRDMNHPVPYSHP